MYASKSTNAFHIILHNFIYFKTTRQRPYSLNLILKSKPNILSAKHYYSVSSINATAAAAVLLPKIFTTTYMIFQSRVSTDKLLQNIKTEQLQLQSSM